MTTEKINAMVSKEHFEGLLKYYGKMNVGQYLKQWVTLSFIMKYLSRPKLLKFLLYEERRIALTSNAYIMGESGVVS
jgi:hypothetical protein